MTTLVTALLGAATLTVNTTPSLGSINSYNASGGALAVTLPALASQNVGASCIVEKNVADTSANAITFTCNTGDTFDDTTTSISLTMSGEKQTLQVIQISSTKYWKVTTTSTPKRSTPKRVGSVASTATPTFSTSSYDIYQITALSTPITSWTITGSPSHGDRFELEITDNGTPQSISWSGFTSLHSGVADFPNVTAGGKKMTLQFKYDSGRSSWVLLAADPYGY